jgi:L-malate glycosyltransferase
MPVRRVVMVGPASPAEFAPYLSGGDCERAAGIKGLGGGPVNSLTNALLERGIEVELLTLTSEVTELIHLSGPGLDLRIGPYRSRARHRAKDFYEKERRALSELLGQASGDIVHAHWTYEFALPCEREPRHVLVTAHDAPLTILRLTRDRYRLVRTSLAYRVRMGIRTLSAVSPHIADRWRKEMVYRRPIMVVPNIVGGTAPVQRCLSPDRKVILNTSSAGRLKNVTALIRAFGQVRQQRPDAVLRLVGPGLGSDDELALWASANNLSASVEFLGPVDHDTIPRHLAQADLFAHVSLEEAHSGSVCEAMHAGLPILGGRRSGGVPWTLDGGRCGALVDVTDPFAIARGILGLLADPAAAWELGAAARHRAATVFSREAVVTGYLDAYAEAIRQQQPPRNGRHWRADGFHARQTA